MLKNTPKTPFYRMSYLIAKRVAALSFLLLFTGVAAFSQDFLKNFPESFQVEVFNPLNIVREEVLVTIPATSIQSRAVAFNANAFIVLDGKTEVPSQYNRQDADFAGIVLVLPILQAKEKKVLTVRYNKTGAMARIYTKRTQAELSHKAGGHFENREYIGGAFKNVDYLRVPPEHKDHSWFIRYEGPGWESDKVGYRLYLDQRNATDMFGKVTNDMVLQDVGQDGFDSYHHMQSWGMDVMKVGKSIGIGAIGSFVNGSAVRVEKTDSVDCRITENGAVFSSFLTRYHGWLVAGKKHDVQSRLSIHAGSRLSHEILTVSNQLDNIATGIVKDKTAPLISSKGNKGKWSYLATYGKQSLNAPSDELGLAVFFNPDAVIEYTEDEFSHLVKLKPSSAGNIEYYFMGAWVHEKDGIKTEGDFIKYIDKVAVELANPVQVVIKKKK